MAATLAKTEFVPSGLQHRPDAVLAAIMKGRELGIGPIQALSQIAVIKGKPTMSAELMMALIRRSGHTFTISDSTDVSVTVTARRADTGDAHTETWDMARAEQAGLLGKDNWKTYPQAMLRARAISATARFLFPDVLLGVSYVPDEVDELVPEIESPREVTPRYEISDAQRAQAAQLGNSLDQRWPPGRYAARLGALDGDFARLLTELVELHVQQHGADDPHVKAAATGAEEPA